MDTQYSTCRDGKFVTVPPIDELCTILRTKFQDQEKENLRLKEENKKLKNGIWAQEEVAKYKSQYEKMQEDYRRGFPISEEEAEKLVNWKKTHDCPRRGTRASGYCTYRFTPTELGTSAWCECSCGKKFQFQELG